MDERVDMVLKETVTSRRVIAKGAAAGGLATLFAAVATGRVLADGSPDTRGDVDDVTDCTSFDGDDLPTDSGGIDEDDLLETGGPAIRGGSGGSGGTGGTGGRGGRKGRRKGRKKGGK